MADVATREQLDTLIQSVSDSFTSIAHLAQDLASTVASVQAKNANLQAKLDAAGMVAPEDFTNEVTRLQALSDAMAAVAAATGPAPAAPPVVDTPAPPAADPTPSKK